MIRTIIFDLGRVLIPFDFERGYAQMAARSGLTAEEIRERIHASGVVPEYECGRIESGAFVRTIGKTLGVELSVDEFSRMWSSIFLPHTLVPEEFVESLRRKYRMLLLSNTNELHYATLWETYPILRHFDAYILSHEVKAMKPEPAIYEATLRQADAAPGECFFTDDMAPFVEGARRHGIDAVQFQGYEKLRDDLTRRGVSW